MSSIAWVTCQKNRGLIPDEQLVVANLQKKHQVDVVIWDSKEVNWPQYDLVIIRSTWDYHLKYRAFLEWLELLEYMEIHVMNPPSIMRWNSHKFYLRELQQQGFNVVPGFYVHAQDSKALKRTMGMMTFDQIVIKPAVAASAHGLIKVPANRLMDDAVLQLLQGHDLIIQPYMGAIEELGEYSFMFFDKIHSHTVLKKPKSGDFRVQQELGGSAMQVIADPEILVQVNRLVHHIREDLLYCRVDGIVADGQFCLMELELIEPDLFLSTDEAQRRFEQVIEQSI